MCSTPFLRLTFCPKTFQNSMILTQYFLEHLSNLNLRPETSSSLYSIL